MLTEVKHKVTAIQLVREHVKCDTLWAIIVLHRMLVSSSIVCIADMHRH